MVNLHERMNYEYLSIFKEISPMAKLQIKHKQGDITKAAKKILIVNTGLIGEFMLSIPAIKHLIDTTKAEVDIIVPPQLEQLASRIIGINKVFTSKSVYKRQTEAIKRENGDMQNDYDLAIVFQISNETYNLLKKASFKHVKVFLGPYIKYCFYVGKNFSKGHNLKQLEEFNFELIGEKHRKIDFDHIFKFKREDYQNVKNLPFFKDSKSKNIVIHTGSGWSLKMWKNERWVELINKINDMGKFKFIFIGSTEKEEKAFEEISKKLDFKVYSAIKKTNLMETALILKHSDYFIGVDSGPRHIAHLMNMPSICLIGPVPKIYNPKNRNAIMIDKSECKCISVWCYKKQPCIEKITVSEVLTEFNRLAKSKPLEKW